MFVFVPATIHGADKNDTNGEMSHHSHTRPRDLVTYDHQVLDGEIFLQVRNYQQLFKKLRWKPHWTENY